MSSSSFQVRPYFGLAGLQALLPDWRALSLRLGASGHFFHHPEWALSYLEALEPAPASVLFLALYSGDRLQVVLPLRPSRWRLSGLSLPVWEAPCHSHVSLVDAVVDPALAERDWLQPLLHHLHQASPVPWRALLWRGTLQQSFVSRVLPHQSPRSLWRHAFTRCDTLVCPSYEELQERFSKNFRGNLRKARNKLARLPGLRFVSVSDPAELPAAFASFVGVEASGWKGRSGTGSAISLDPRLLAFYQGLLRHFGSHCRINLLFDGELCLAAQFCLRLGPTLYVLKIGYHEDHAALAPGNMLLEWVIQSAVAGPDPVRSFNLISGARWHDDWKPESEPVYDVWVARPHWPARGLFAAASLLRSVARIRSAGLRSPGASAPVGPASA